MDKLQLIIRREYLERVATKSFIITTILMPLFMVAMMVAPALIMALSGPEDKNIAVVDNSGLVAKNLQSTDEVKYHPVPADFPIDSLKQSELYDAVLVIDVRVVDFPDKVSLYTHGAPSMQTEEFIASSIRDVISKERAKKYNIDNLQRILEDVNPKVRISTYRIDADSEEETSSAASYIIGLMASMMLYMFIMIYGNMVMNSIIEEKNNRVLEIIVSSVRPTILMMGKIIGVALVAITQILIWAILVGSFSKWVMPLIINSLGNEPGLTSALGQFSQTGYVMTIFMWIILFLTAGFLFYSTIYAAIGSAVDNIQDASQLSSIAVVPIILGFVFTMLAINDPNSTVAVWMSMIPFTSPMVMIARIPFGIPTWEILLSLAILIVSFLVLVWISAKIYRVGIFMYGKKPTFTDLIRWARYK